MLMIAALLPPETEGSEPRGIVGTPEDGLTMVVVCKRVDTTWEPVCGLRAGMYHVTLPPCFSLCSEAVDALEVAYADGV
jgi:hypothetical protein